nr:MAG TPA: hypothetical protein [Caudoviricetes sp.]
MKNSSSSTKNKKKIGAAIRVSRNTHSFFITKNRRGNKVNKNKNRGKE